MKTNKLLKSIILFLGLFSFGFNLQAQIEIDYDNVVEICEGGYGTIYLPPILVPVVKLKKQYIYKFSKRLNYEKQEEKIHKIVQT
jgi:hypothetical protein